MPYKSDAQRRKFHAMLAEGKISQKTVGEYDEASKGLNLPDHVKSKKVSPFSDKAFIKRLKGK